MKKFVNIICVLGMALMLGACSYFETEEKIDLSSQPPVQQSQSETYDLRNVNPANIPTDSEVAEIIKHSSDGSIEIYPLDGGEPLSSDDGFSRSSDRVEIEPVSAVPAYNEFKVNAYPGVEIYPLDDEMARLVEPHSIMTPTVAPVDLAPFPVSENNPDHGSDFVDVRLPGGGPVVHFDHDSVALRPEDQQMLIELARNYNGREDISVAGHASVQSSVKDPIERKIVNLKISMDRAFSVARALIEGGIPPERIETKGYGEVRPPGYTGETTDVASRRVEITGISVQ